MVDPPPPLSLLCHGLPKLFDLGKSVSFYMTLKLVMADSNSSFDLTFAFTFSDISISTAAFKTYNANKSLIGYAQRRSHWSATDSLGPLNDLNAIANNGTRVDDTNMDSGAIQNRKPQSHVTNPGARRIPCAIDRFWLGGNSRNQEQRRSPFLRPFGRISLNEF
ncbi:hypothetical protein PIB30_014538 [Stylosanthes scabra]|uniref:Uncharacterized protein n=1 Tax=Stylosanthes scabra TaxID=79078 RepID=A0ABU6Y3M8_9FABA|nr:hypothetical protein [Stylosanthes scabra]